MLETKLLDLDEAKASLNVEHDEDDELITDLIVEAEANFENYVESPITKETFTEYFNGGGSKLFLRHFPVDASSVTITDREDPDDTTDDEVQDEDKYEVYPQEGIIVRTTPSGDIGRGVTWAHGARRWEVQYDAGLDQSDDWTQDEQTIKSSIRDLVVHRYEFAKPNVKRERWGAGRQIDTKVGPLPVRVKSVWDRFTPVGQGF
jgi:hypothetical protein